MEERRLKSILSHLSACSPSQMGKSSALNASSKTEKRIVYFPGNVHSQHEMQVYRTPISRSRSSSDVLESRHFGSAEETLLREDARYAAFHEKFSSHGHTSAEHKCGRWQLSKRHSSEEIEDSPCMYSTNELMPNTQGYSLEATELNKVQGRNSTPFLHNCSSSGAPKLDWSMQCKSLHFNDGLVVGAEEKQSESRRDILFHQRLSTYQSQVRNASISSSEGDRHQEVVHEPQASTSISDMVQNTDEGDIQACRDTQTLDSQGIEVGSDGARSISRNNVMTGQRRRIVEDCIFCLIIQGQSPAFKLYEDDMCVCILDVHPLSHGHSLLIPKTHFPSLELTPPEVAAAMCATVPLLSMAIMQATNCDSFNLLVNSGKAAGQVVFHTHFHIIPRRSGDNLWRSEDDNRRALPVGHETALLVQQIRLNLSNKHM